MPTHSMAPFVHCSSPVKVRSAFTCLLLIHVYPALNCLGLNKCPPPPMIVYVFICSTIIFSHDNYPYPWVLLFSVSLTSPCVLHSYPTTSPPVMPRFSPCQYLMYVIFILTVTCKLAFEYFSFLFIFSPFPLSV